MRSIKFLLLPLFTGILFVACSDDDDNDDPAPMDTEVTITTLNIAFFESGSTEASLILLSRDPDGDGPTAPEITLTGLLNSNTTYDGIIQVSDETVTPVQDVNEKIEEEDDEHQFFFEATGNITDVSYADEDENGNPVGLSFTLTTGGEGVASLTVTLRNGPQKPNNGTLAGAGGETIFAQTFSNLVIN